MPSESAGSSGTHAHGIDAVTRFLEGQGIRYEVVEHETTYTAAAEARAVGVQPYDAAKTVVLRADDGYRLAVIPASEQLDLHKLRLVPEGGEVRLASEHEMAEAFPEFDVGALPPFGPMLPALEILDRRLLDHDRILCNGGDHRHSLLLDPHDIVRAAHPRVADICRD